MEWLFAAIIIIVLKIFWHQRNEKSSSLTFMFIYNFIMTFFFPKQKQQQIPPSKNCDVREELDLIQLLLSWDNKQWKGKKKQAK